MPNFTIIPNTGDKCITPLPSGIYNRPWQRFTVTKGASSNFTNNDLDMRRKAETLRYVNTQNNITTKQHFSKAVNIGNGLVRRRQFAAQPLFSNDIGTSSNIDNLTREGDVLFINTSCPLKTTGLTSDSNVPGPLMTLEYNTSVPLTRYVPVKRTYVGAEGK